MIEGFLKITYWLCEIINKAQNLNFNQSSSIGCLGLNLDFVIVCFAQGGGRMWIPDIGLGGRNIFCDLLLKYPVNKPNSAPKEVGKFRCTENTKFTYLLFEIVTESQTKVNQFFYNATQVHKLKYGKEEVSPCFAYIF